MKCISRLIHKHRCVYVYVRLPVVVNTGRAARHQKTDWANPHCSHPGRYCTATHRQKEAFKNYLFEEFIFCTAIHSSWVWLFLDVEPLPTCQLSRQALHYPWITGWPCIAAKFKEVSAVHWNMTRNKSAKKLHFSKQHIFISVYKYSNLVT